MEIKWSDELATGHGDIDADHQKLIGIINHLATLIQSEDIEQIGDILCELTEYVTIHFGREEFIMQAVRYPQSESHQMAHCEFFAKLTKFVYLYETGEAGLGQDILDYLGEWLKAHEANEDKALVQTCNFTAAIS